ncbi:hypothetical protein HDE_14030 [Halotydeus destructor]|nr:hypothetical protein HDE_14030 [Halotydeus destructor]
MSSPSRQRKPVFRVVARRVVCVFPKHLYRRKRTMNRRIPLSYPLLQRVEGIRDKNRKLVETNIELLDTIRNLNQEKDHLQSELLFNRNQSKRRESYDYDLLIEQVQKMLIESVTDGCEILKQHRVSRPPSSASQTSTSENNAPVKYAMSDEEKENSRILKHCYKTADFHQRYGKLTPVMELSAASTLSDISNTTRVNNFNSGTPIATYSKAMPIRRTFTPPKNSPSESSDDSGTKTYSSPASASPSIFNFEPQFPNEYRANANDDSDTLNGLGSQNISPFRPSFYDDESFLAQIDMTCKKKYMRSTRANSEIPTPTSSAYKRTTGSLNFSINLNEASPKQAAQEDSFINQLAGMNLNVRRSTRAYSARVTSVDNSEFYDTICSESNTTVDENNQPTRPGLRTRKKPISYCESTSQKKRSGMKKKITTRYYLCRNGTLTLEDCPNGLLYQEHGAVFEFCAYNWNVHCPEGKAAPGPVSSPGCPWQFGIFDEAGADKCATHYSECIWGIAERRLCEPKGLVYDDRIKGCNWPDQKGCKGEDVIGVKCPEEDKLNPFYPYPRYLYNDNTIVVCVNDQPRLIHCPEGQLVDQNSYTCVDIEKKRRQ